MNREIRYFGTNLTQAGHYCCVITQNGLTYLRSLIPDGIPFSPEGVTQNLQKGEVHYFHSRSKHGNFTVIAIYGSCRDDRPGTKSVFWVNEIMHFDLFAAELQSIPIAAEILAILNEKYTIKWAIPELLTNEK